MKKIHQKKKNLKKGIQGRMIRKHTIPETKVNMLYLMTRIKYKVLKCEFRGLEHKARSENRDRPQDV